MVGTSGGVTLVELVMAILLLTAGLLGLVSSSALVAHTAAEGRQLAKESFWVGSQTDMLRSRGCNGNALGEWSRSSVGGEWQMRVSSNGMPDGFLVVTSASPERSDTFALAIPCRIIP
ncbi:MAG: hypothetical protein ACE5HT_05120 [Gemmatimonadales bacterium]